MTRMNRTLREEMTMANTRVKEYKVTYEDGTSSLQPFTEAQAADLGTVLEAGGLNIDAAFRLVERWNAQANLQRNEMRYSILLSSLQG